MAHAKNYLWVARNRDESLYLYDEKPIRMKDFFMQRWSFDESWRIPNSLFEPVQWDNSPVMVEIDFSYRTLKR